MVPHSVYTADCTVKCMVSLGNKAKSRNDFLHLEAVKNFPRYPIYTAYCIVQYLERLHPKLCLDINFRKIYKTIQCKLYQNSGTELCRNEDTQMWVSSL